MKKIMIALAAVAMAIGAQAAQVQWTTPVLYAANADGSFNTSQLLKSAGATSVLVELAFFGPTGSVPLDKVGLIK